MPWQRPLRLWRHAITGDAAVRRHFPEPVMARIQQVIVAGEATHSGQVCVAIESALPLVRVLQKFSPRQRALEAFGLLRVWDTEANNGVLIYLLLAEHAIEIVADRGIDARVSPGEWQAICARMDAHFREGRFEQGAVEGVRAVSLLLAHHFPAQGADRNELSDRPVMI